MNSKLKPFLVSTPDLSSSSKAKVISIQLRSHSKSLFPRAYYLIPSSLPLAYCLLPTLAQAQPIVAGNDTNTLVHQQGNKIAIEGGRIAGSNLFHTFRRFGVEENQIVQFLSTQTIRNILARVSSGEPSIINGILQVSGGDSNLVLMNPAGILFGTNARLDVPASFIATTASGIEFNGKWFTAIGTNDYETLAGEPTGFIFPNHEPGSIINEGNLAVQPGESITLLAGSIISTGRLEAPGGQIHLVAVPGENIVRIHHDGYLLNLEVASLADNSTPSNVEQSTLTPLSLPKMLTGGSRNHATEVAMNSQGQIVLTGSPQTPGSIVVTGEIDTSTSSHSEPRLEAGGQVEILGDRITLSSAKIDASGVAGGGSIKIQQYSPLDTENMPTQSFISIDENSAILADAEVNGNGGSIQIAGQNSEISGSISAQGGQDFGDGGTVEIMGSGKFNGTVNLRAENGNFGEVKMSAENIVVEEAANYAVVEEQTVNAENYGTEPEFRIAETTLQEMSANAKVVLAANQDIQVPTYSTYSEQFHPYSVPSSTHAVTYIADQDQNGTGTVTTLPSTSTTVINSNSNFRQNRVQSNPNSLTWVQDETAPRQTQSVVSTQIPVQSAVNLPSNSFQLSAKSIDSTIALPPEFIVQLEHIRNQEFNPSLGSLDTQPLNFSSIQDSLARVAQTVGKNPAIVYLVSRHDYLELVLLTPNGSPRFKRVIDANQPALQQQIRALIAGVSRPPDPNNPNDYLVASQQLYQWIIAPLEQELKQQGIDTLVFSLDPGMRMLPLAALHDGEQFLVQKYSLGLIPSLSLTDIRYQNLSNLSVLAMGAAEFVDPEVVPLPAVPLELTTITRDWRGKSFLNQDFTWENLKSQRQHKPFQILHLATHGSFDLKDPKNSYLQFWDQKLHFDQLRELKNLDEPLELLVLSACETAFGSVDAELGLAGLAVQSGVKSVLASLWQVDDAGTLGLMSEFYRQLSRMTYTIKSEALRQAQIAMIEGKVRVESGELRSTSRGENGIPLPQTQEIEQSLSHPYYWASFTMIGSPW